jgi:hypothetical protein
MKYTEQEYLNSGYYECDMDSEVENQKVKIVKCRQPHKCMGGCDGEIQPGEFAYYESGFMDGKPASCYTCLPCIDKWLDELHEHDNGDEGEAE